MTTPDGLPEGATPVGDGGAFRIGATTYRDIDVYNRAMQKQTFGDGDDVNPVTIDGVTYRNPELAARRGAGPDVPNIDDTVTVDAFLESLGEIEDQKLAHSLRQEIQGQRHAGASDGTILRGLSNKYDFDVSAAKKELGEALARYSDEALNFAHSQPTPTDPASSEETQDPFEWTPEQQRIFAEKGQVTIDGVTYGAGSPRDQEIVREEVGRRAFEQDAGAQQIADEFEGEQAEIGREAYLSDTGAQELEQDAGLEGSLSALTDDVLRTIAASPEAGDLSTQAAELLSYYQSAEYAQTAAPILRMSDEELQGLITEASASPDVDGEILTIAQREQKRREEARKREIEALEAAPPEALTALLQDPESEGYHAYANHVLGKRNREREIQEAGGIDALTTALVAADTQRDTRLRALAGGDGALAAFSSSAFPAESVVSQEELDQYIETGFSRDVQRALANLSAAERGGRQLTDEEYEAFLGLSREAEAQIARQVAINAILSVPAPLGLAAGPAAGLIAGRTIRVVTSPLGRIGGRVISDASPITSRLGAFGGRIVADARRLPADLRFQRLPDGLPAPITPTASGALTLPRISPRVGILAGGGIAAGAAQQIDPNVLAEVITPAFDGSQLRSGGLQGVQDAGGAIDSTTIDIPNYGGRIVGADIPNYGGRIIGLGGAGAAIGPINVPAGVLASSQVATLPREAVETAEAVAEAQEILRKARENARRRTSRAISERGALNELLNAARTNPNLQVLTVPPGVPGAGTSVFIAPVTALSTEPQIVTPITTQTQPAIGTDVDSETVTPITTQAQPVTTTQTQTQAQQDVRVEELTQTLIAAQNAEAGAIGAVSAATNTQELTRAVEALRQAVRTRTQVRELLRTYAGTNVRARNALATTTAVTPAVTTAPDVAAPSVTATTAAPPTTRVSNPDIPITDTTIRDTPKIPPRTPRKPPPDDGATETKRGAKRLPGEDFPEQVAWKQGFGYWNVDVDTGESVFTLENPGVPDFEGEGSADDTFRVLDWDNDPPTDHELDMGIVKARSSRSGLKYNAKNRRPAKARRPRKRRK